MTTLNGIAEKVEHAMGLIESAIAFLPGTDPRVMILRSLVQKSHEVLNTSGIRTALAEVEAKYSAEAQAIADAWPDEPTKR
jgi:hypothetical protein